MKYKLLSWELFRAFCRMDGEIWHDQGYTADELTAEDILTEYPEDYFDSDEFYSNGIERTFTPEEFVEKTLEFMKEIEGDEYYEISCNPNIE